MIPNKKIHAIILFFKNFFLINKDFYFYLIIIVIFISILIYFILNIYTLYTDSEVFIDYNNNNNARIIADSTNNLHDYFAFPLSVNSKN